MAHWALAQPRPPGMALVDPDIFNKDPREHYDLLQRLGGGTYGEVFKVRKPFCLLHHQTWESWGEADKQDCKRMPGFGLGSEMLGMASYGACLMANFPFTRLETRCLRT